MEEVVNLLIEKNKTISTMESCTGGGISNAITNIPNASKVFSFSAITYSNEYKIKMGVDEKLINNYTVYSMEVARDMARVISKYTNSNYGVGITGKLKKIDENNLTGEDDVVYLAIYDYEKNTFETEKIKLKYEERVDNKNQIINTFVEKMKKVLEEK